MPSNTFRASVMCLVGGMALTGCLPAPEEPGPDAAVNSLAVSASSTQALTWVQYCFGCIMPNLEFDLSYPQYDRQGWTIAFNYPVLPPKPLIWNRTTQRYDPPFTDFADMDNSVGEIFIVPASTGRIANLNINSPVWKDLPVAPKGARRIGVNATRDIAIVTNEAKAGGYGIQLYSPASNSWVDIAGGAIDLDFDTNGDLWVVNDKAWIFKRPKATGIWEGMGDVNTEGARAIAIAVGGGRAVVLTNKTANNGYTLMQHTASRWIPIPGELDHINIDAGGKLWGSNNKSVSFWCQL